METKTTLRNVLVSALGWLLGGIYLAAVFYVLEAMIQ